MLPRRCSTLNRGILACLNFISKFLIIFGGFFCNFSVRILSKKNLNLFFAHENMKKLPSKVAQVFFSLLRRKLIFLYWNLSWGTLCSFYFVPPYYWQEKFHGSRKFDAEYSASIWDLMSYVLCNVSLSSQFISDLLFQRRIIVLKSKSRSIRDTTTQIDWASVRTRFLILLQKTDIKKFETPTPYCEISLPRKPIRRMLSSRIIIPSKTYPILNETAGGRAAV